MARFLLVLILLAAAIAGFGYYRQWFRVNVDEGKIKQDAEVAQEKARELGDKAKGLIAGEPVTAQGTIKHVDVAGDGHIVLQTNDGQDVTIYLEPKTAVQRNNKPVRLLSRGLASGDGAVVVYQTKDGKNVAQSITAQK